MSRLYSKHEFDKVDLHGTRFSGDDFSEDFFIECNLKNCVFVGCNFNGTTFNSCDLDYAQFIHCAFNGDTEFYGCDLYVSKFDHCCLTNVLFTNSRFNDTNFLFCKDIPTHLFPSICPESGGFTAYKALYLDTAFSESQINEANFYCIAELYIPKNAKRVSYYGNRKCRASEVKVVKFYDLLGNVIDADRAYSFYGNNDGRTVYAKGQYVYPDCFDDRREIECSNGIHFFMTFKDATEYANGDMTMSNMLNFRPFEDIMLFKKEDEDDE